jgi:Ca2+-binding RTX toxin-like protein
LLGGAGDDVLAGRGGADYIDGGSGNDVALISRTNLSSPYTFDFSSGVGGDITEPEGARLISIEHIQFSGGAGVENVSGGANNDLFRGGDGNDMLSGGGGNDLIAGQGGADILSGGAGVDRFLFEKSTDGRDVIADFTPGVDSLLFSASEFGGGLVAGDLATLVTALSAAAASNPGSNGYFIFDNAGADAGTVLWDPTGGSGADAVAVATLPGVISLPHSDLLIV